MFLSNIKTTLFQCFGMLFLILFTLQAYAYGASFDCRDDLSLTKVESRICHNRELSRLDVQLNAVYQIHLAKIPKSQTLKQEQRHWLKIRNRCQDDDCLARLYTARLKVLNGDGIIPFTPKAWVKKRQRDIINVLKDKKLFIHPKTPSNTPFCHQLLKGVKTLSGMEIIAPEVMVNNLDAPALGHRIFDRCPKIYNKTSAGTLMQPRKGILYHVDIDNNVSNGIEWVLGDHYILPIHPEWGKELLVYNEYIYFNVEQCKQLDGAAGVGGSQRYGYKTNYAEINLDTGIHGIVRYRNRYYIYDIIDEKKVTPFGLREYFPDKKRTKSKCDFFERL